MARASVRKLIERIIDMVEDDSDIYRKLKSDKQVHFVTINAEKIIVHVKTEMYRREGMGKEGDVAETKTGDSVFRDNSKGFFSTKIAKFKLDKVINKEVPKMCERFYDLAKAKLTTSRDYIVSELTGIPPGNKKHFTVMVAEKKGGNTFEYVKASLKQVAQKPLIDALNDWAAGAADEEGNRNTGGGWSRRDDKAEYSRTKGKINKKTGKNKYADRDITEKQQLLNKQKGYKYEGGDTKVVMISREILARPEDAMWPMEHTPGYSVSEQRQKYTRQEIEEAKQKELVKFDEETNAKVAAFIDDLTDRIEWTVDYGDMGDFDKYTHIEIGSQRENTKKVNKENVALTAQLLRALERLGEKGDKNGWENQEASDSMVTRVLKASKNALVKEIKGRKNIKRRNLEHEKINRSKGKVTKRVKPPKITIGTIAAIKINDKTKTRASLRKKGKNVRKQAAAAAAPLELIGLINKELPDVVRSNMGAPSLTNVTGRFASSVRATDMIMTPQGFPSIGYTYQRNPYETFERDVNYDPRSLIDRSMREIAAQYAIGRFYTRRV
jgi:hypothetical protein